MSYFQEAEQIKVGVIGYGGAYNMGRQHLEAMRKAGMTPVAVAELDPERLRVAGADFPGIRTYSSIDEMLDRDEVNLITIITPHNTHASLAEQCLNAGRHVVSEKPLAITTGEVDSMIAAAKRNNVMLSTYHNRHWDGWIQEAVRRIRHSNEIGDIIAIDAHMTTYGQPGDWWRSSRSFSGGILYDWGVHLIEYSLQLIDSEVTEVSGFAFEGFWSRKTRWKEDTNEDDAFAVVRFRSGQRLTLHFSQVDAKGKDGFLEIQGTLGVYTMDPRKLTIHKVAGKERTTIELPGPERGSDGYYQNVAGFLTGKEKLIIDAAWSRRPVHIIDLAVQSAKLGRALPAQDSRTG